MAWPIVSGTWKVSGTVDVLAVLAGVRGTVSRTVDVLAVLAGCEGKLAGLWMFLLS